MVQYSLRASISASCRVFMLPEILTQVQHVPLVSLTCGIMSVLTLVKFSTRNDFGNIWILLVFLNLFVLNLALWRLDVYTVMEGSGKNKARVNSL